MTSPCFNFKGSVQCIFASLFLKSKRKQLWNLEKWFLFHFKNLFSFSRKWNFRILDIQISWRHKCLSIKQEIYFNLYSKHLGSKHSLLMKFGQFMSYYKRKNYQTIQQKLYLEISSRPFCVCKELSTTSIGKQNFWSEILILDMY